MPYLLEHIPAGMSKKQGIHFRQILNSGKKHIAMTAHNNLTSSKQWHTEWEKEDYLYRSDMILGRFEKFDYGREKNLEFYGSEIPPEYDLKNVTAPVALYYGKNDLLVDTRVRYILLKLWKI